MRSSPITWMATIARNCALDEVNRSALPLSEDDCELIERAGADNPADQYERAEDARRLQACLGRLGPEKSSLVVQAYYYGMSRKDIAKRTGQPVSTVKTWLRRSLAELRGYLEEEKGDDLRDKVLRLETAWAGPGHSGSGEPSLPRKYGLWANWIRDGDGAERRGRPYTGSGPKPRQKLSSIQSIRANRLAAFFGVERQIDDISLCRGRANDAGVKGGAAGRVRRNPQSAPVGLDNRPANRETHAHTA